MPAVSGLVQTGHWFYSGDPLAGDRDEVRLLMADTLPDDQLLSDEEINAALRISERSGRPGGTCSTPALTLHAAAAAGAVTLELGAPAVSGTLTVGDSFTISGNTQRYQVTNTVTASGNVFTSVAISPGVVAAATSGTAVALRFANVYEAAALCLETIAKRWARYPDETIDGRTVHYSQRAATVAAQATALRKQAGHAGGGGFLPLVRC